MDNTLISVEFSGESPRKDKTSGWVRGHTCDYHLPTLACPHFALMSNVAPVMVGPPPGTSGLDPERLDSPTETPVTAQASGRRFSLEIKRVTRTSTSAVDGPFCSQVWELGVSCMRACGAGHGRAR